eukprot:snap_masked-scaffold_40-processed-gene-0.36-mRNA-1 protein AED:0.20 eAED:0.22 QI:0/0/0/1/1/1/2/0/934
MALKTLPNISKRLRRPRSVIGRKFGYLSFPGSGNIEQTTSSQVKVATLNQQLLQSLEFFKLTKQQREQEETTFSKQLESLNQNCQTLFSQSSNFLQEASLESDSDLVLVDPLDRVVLQWKKDLATAIENLIYTRNTQVTPYIGLLDPSAVANVVVSNVLYSVKLEPSGVPLVRLSDQVGRALKTYVDFFKNVSQEKDPSTYFKTKVESRTRRMQNFIEKREEVLALKEWDQGLLIKSGATLVDLLLKICDADMQQRNLQRKSSLENVRKEVLVCARGLDFEMVNYKDGKKIRMVVPHKALLENLARTSKFTQQEPALTAMVCPPRKWTSADDGGFFFQKHQIFKNKREKSAQIKAIAKGKNFKNKTKDVQEKQPEAMMFQVLNILAGLPWSINTKVFELAKTVHEQKLHLGGLIGHYEKEHPPAKPEYDSFRKKEDFFKAKREYNLILERINRDFHSQQSKRLDAELKLETASYLKDHDRFWFPFNYDFRGRVYPLPPHLNHLQGDLARALLMFQKGKVLGPRGLRWLKIHLANLFGNDKVSFDEREQYVNDMIYSGEINKMAQKPLENQKWAEADYPYQAIAVIFELNEAVKSGNPEGYVSKVAVHQDGSCNGLQHYAALGRDKFGGSQVNLIPDSKPKDVYSEVLKRVKEKLEEVTLSSPSANLEKEDAFGTEDIRLARIMSGWVDRKVVKQTVMTSVYGVTFIGAKDQIFSQLETKNDKLAEKYGKNSEHVLTQVEMSQAAKLIAGLTLGAIGDTFKGAAKTMSWLREISRSCATMDESMKWISPFGLPIDQTYSKKEQQRIRVGTKEIWYNKWHSDSGKIDKRKQTTAFPPNFVHSIDAAHLALTCLECYKRGIDFTAVHDSYWTHAADIDEMNTVLREEFVNLHSNELLVQLYEDVTQRFPQLKETLSKPPIIGDLDLEKVKESKYFFS